MKTSVVIGIGNPVIADDALGIEVARCVRQQLVDNRHVAVTEVYNGGFDLMEAMAGFDRAFVVDAIVTGSTPGTIHRLTVDEIGDCRNTSTTHNGSLSVALEFGRLSGVKLPDTIRIWAVEAGDISTFREELTLEVKRAAPVVAAEILHELALNQNEIRRLTP